LSVEERACIDEHLEKNVTRFNSFLDFYCPGCNCPITILFDGGFSGYGGLFEFEIKDVLSIKS
jgi:hypothetical protein